MRYFIFAVMVCLLSACSETRAVFAMMKSTDNFRTLRTDPRVRYEPGAETNASIIAANLNQSIRQVEQTQHHAFIRPIIIYVPASVKSFESYCATPKAGGCVLNQRLFISPKKQNTARRIPFILTHELSHLQMEQILGMWKWHDNVPTWFREGLAVYVSDGGGAGNITPTQARLAILAGKSFTPNTSGSLLFRRTAHSFGLKPHMFYRQAGMFVAWLHNTNNQRFKKLLSGLQKGMRFKDAMHTCYQTGVKDAWRHFTLSLKNQEPAQA